MSAPGGPAVDDDGRLLGTARVVALLQSDDASPLADICDRNPVRIGPGTDVTDVAVLMIDTNLTTIPVVNGEGRMLGLVTVDDVLEVTLPEDWRRREAALRRTPTWGHQAKTASRAAPGAHPSSARRR